MWKLKWNKKEKPLQDKMIALLHDHQTETVSHDKITSWIISEDERVRNDILKNNKKKTLFRYPPQEWETHVRYDAVKRLCALLKKEGIKYQFGKVNPYFEKEV